MSDPRAPRNGANDRDIDPEQRIFEQMTTVSVEGLHVHRLTMTEAVRACSEAMTWNRAALLVTPNSDHLVRWLSDATFRRAYAAADIVVADGTPLVWLSRLQDPQRPLPERLAGVDLVWQLCKHLGADARLFILGSDDASAQLAAQRLNREFGVETVGHLSPRMPDDPTGFEGLEGIVEALADARPNLVLLAFGSPKQEILYSAIASRLDRGLFVACGATVDFFAGTRSRAPRWVQACGLEWLYRLAREPRRLWRRYLVTDMAILLILARGVGRRLRSAQPPIGPLMG